MRATVDVLGEEITRADEAEALARAYRDALAGIGEDGLDANLSIKLTGFGLKLDDDLCRSLVAGLVPDAGERRTSRPARHGGLETTDATLDLYRALRAEGHDNVGIVLQAALRRTLSDIEALAPLEPSVRLCKGIYVEPPSVAVPGVRGDPHELRRVPRRAARERTAASRSRRTTSGSSSTRSSASTGLDERSYELQMLLGVRGDRARQLVAAGHPLRIYVPYGEQWYEYALRRLQENPKVAGYVAKDMLSRFLPGRIVAERSSAECYGSVCTTTSATPGSAARIPPRPRSPRRARPRA